MTVDKEIERISQCIETGTDIERRDTIKLLAAYRVLLEDLERIRIESHNRYEFDKQRTIELENRVREARRQLLRDGADILRPEVRWFAEQMELALRRNDHKGGWQDCDYEYLSDRLRDETLELEGAVFGGGLNEAIINEAVDVANFAMMIADNARKAGAQSHD